MDTHTDIELLRPWAKQDDQGRIHPLVCHLIDTMEAARHLYPTLLGDQVREEMDEVFGPLTGGDPEQTAAWVALLCGLADLGMYSPAFQATSTGVAKERFPRSEHELLDFCADLREKNLSPHGITTGVHLDVLLDSLDAQVPTRIVLSRVVASHHGDVPSAAGIAQYRDARGGRHRKDIAQGLWSEGRTAMVRKLARLAGVEFDHPGWAEVNLQGVSRRCARTGRVLNALLALVAVSVRTACQSGLFSCEPDPGPLEAYRARAAERAAQAQTQPGQVGTWTVTTERETWSFGPESLADGTVQLHLPNGDEWITCPRPGPFQ